MGDQIKGFGYTQEGAADTVFRFHTTNGFLQRPPETVTPQDPGNPGGLEISEDGMEIRRNLEQYLMVFETNFFPVMGQQVTLFKNNNKGGVKSRIKLLMDRADLGECDLVARRNSNDGYLYVGGNSFQTNKAADKLISAGRLRAFAKDGSTITYTCTPPGSGMRIALDRDQDGVLDGDEIAAGSDPADAASVPF
jgi:hypothetical protein